MSDASSAQMSPSDDSVPRPALLWHGGAPGLRVGDRLLPPSQTGLAFTRLQASLEAGLGPIAQRPDRVYMTSERKLARAWAGIWTLDGVRYGGGALYRCEPDEPLEPDPDLASLVGVSFQALSATIRVVYDTYVPFEQRYARDLQRTLDRHHAAKRAREAAERAAREAGQMGQAT